MSLRIGSGRACVKVRTGAAPRLPPCRRTGAPRRQQHTVIGYSVNDTVVVFDRVREARRRDPAADLETTANKAVIQTLPRTVNTGMGALFILAALAVLGGDSLADFSMALIAGVVIGMASTVLTAVPIAVQLEGSRPAPPVRPKRSEGNEDSGARSPLERRGRARDSGAVV